MKVAIVGGGPAGLATLRFLAHAHAFFPIPPIEVRLFEATDEIGGTFVQRVYEDAELVSSKYLTAFSDFRLPRDAPDFVTPRDYVRYLHDYITHFSLRPHIRCGVRVTRISRDGALHIVETTTTSAAARGGGGGGGGEKETWRCDAVAICTGLNAHPRIPAIPGIDSVPLVLHSSQVKSRAQFGRGTHVVVLGAGETGMDMAHLAVTSPTASVTLCHREGFFCAPKIIPMPAPRGRAGKASGTARPNKPVDTSVASLFDTAYAHPVLQRSRLLWLAYDTWVKKMHWLISGTEEGPDQWVGHMSKERKKLDSLFMVKSDRALPYISAGHRSTSVWNALRASILNVPIRDNHGRTIDVRPWPQGIDDDGSLRFREDTGKQRPPREQHIKPDVIVLATGYDTVFPFLDGPAYPALDDANVRGIYSAADASVAYIGFVRPSIGAMPPLAELQAQLWTLRLLQHHRLVPPPSPSSSSPPNMHTQHAVAPYEMDYKLHARAGYDKFREKRGVDHESYAYQLALDMGAAPRLSYVLRSGGWRCFYAWAMGSNFNTKFRLVGPWRDEICARGIMAGELYDVVKRSGGLVYLTTYTIIPLLVFGTISIGLYVFFWVTSLPERAAASVGRLFGKTDSEKRMSQKCLVLD